MKLKDIIPAKGSVKKRRRKGRGNSAGQGGECGRGHKGQKSRSGYSYRAGFEGGQMPLYRRIPKKRGTGNNVQKVEYSIVNVGQINAMFETGAVIEPATLAEKNLVQKNTRVKILGQGELTKNVTIKAHKFSKSALEKLKNTATIELIK